MKRRGWNYQVIIPIGPKYHSNWLVFDLSFTPTLPGPRETKLQEMFRSCWSINGKQVASIWQHVSTRNFLFSCSKTEILIDFPLILSWYWLNCFCDEILCRYIEHRVAASLNLPFVIWKIDDRSQMLVTASCLLLPPAKQQNLYFEPIARCNLFYFYCKRFWTLGLSTVKDIWSMETYSFPVSYFNVVEASSM